MAGSRFVFLAAIGAALVGSCGGEAPPERETSARIVIPGDDATFILSATHEGAVVIDVEPVDGPQVGRVASAQRGGSGGGGGESGADAILPGGGDGDASGGLQISYGGSRFSGRSGASVRFGGASGATSRFGGSSGAATRFEGSSRSPNVSLSCEPGILCDFVGSLEPSSAASCRRDVGSIRVPAELERLFCLGIDLVACVVNVSSRTGGLLDGNSTTCVPELERYLAELRRLGFDLSELD